MTMHHDVGETAGKVWHLLHQRGPATVAEIATGVGCQREAVERAIGWLAREDKLDFHGTGHGEKLSLTKEAVAAEASK
jgi:predicted ArsR family transcriptional regulator